jgi:hypothetical protein
MATNCIQPSEICSALEALLSDGADSEIVETESTTQTPTTPDGGYRVDHSSVSAEETTAPNTEENFPSQLGKAAHLSVNSPNITTRLGKDTSVYVSVDLDRFKDHVLPEVSKITDVAKYTTELPLPELVCDVILIGRRMKSFKDWFLQHAEFVHTLRDQLPKRGRNSIEVIEEGSRTVYTWGEFCVKFFGVGSEWVRQQLALYEGIIANPDKPELPKLPKKGKKSREEGDSETQDEQTSILIHNELVDLLERFSKRNWEIQFGSVTGYENRKMFVDYLRYAWKYFDDPDELLDFLATHKKVVDDGLSRFASEPRVRSKFSWLRRYHNSTIRRMDTPPGVKDLLS